MALSMNDFYNSRPIDPRRRIVNPALARQRPAMGGMRGLGAMGGKGAALAAMGTAARQRGDELTQQGNALIGQISAFAPAFTRKADQVAAAADATGDPDAIDQAQSMLSMASEAADLSSKLVREFNNAKDEFEAKYTAATQGGPIVGPSTADRLQSAVDALKTASADFAAYETKAGVIRTAVNRLVTRAQSQAKAEQLAQAAAQAAAQQSSSQAAAAAALEARRLEQQAAAEERAYQLQLQREEAQRQREDAAEARRLAAEQQARDDEARRRAEQQAREDALIARQEAAEQAAQAAAAAREQAKADAEARREAMAQEALLRQEEAQLRREEREAELQRLMTMQELAAKGVPSFFAPPGAASFGPSVPQAAFPGATAGGYPGAPSGYPGGYPGAPQGAYPGVQPGYAATPPQATAPQAWQAPSQAPLPEGMAWSQLDPGSELFGVNGMGGMGAFVPTGNPLLRGSKIEYGYTLRGPVRGYYEIRNPAGSTIYANLTDDELTGPLEDPETGAVIYAPPPPAGPSTGETIATGIAAALAEGVKSTRDVIMERDRLKQERRMARSAPQPVDSGVSYEPEGRRGGGWGGYLLVGALGLGAIAVGFALKKKKPANAAKSANAAAK